MKNVYSVGQVNSYIKNMFAQDFMMQNISVQGEVSNCKYHSSGHIYFTLKDPKGVIACVMFAGNRSGLRFRMEAGMQVIVTGSIQVFERDGRYQLYAKQIFQDGIGYLYERFERLKNELEERGLFAPEYKKPIPRYIRTLGVVTAPTGAAVQDIINIASRRNPGVQIILYPALVQGENAAASIVRGIHALEKLGVDVMIVGRGGGSMEDLWAFNEEIVAQAVFDCQIPIISAVGHETDTTIIDFVSDLRAPTPSAAAELAVYELSAVQEALGDIHANLDRMMRKKLNEERLKLALAAERLQRVSPKAQLQDKKQFISRSEKALRDAMRYHLESARHTLALYIERLRGVSPLDRLEAGYAHVENAAGRSIGSTGDVSVGDSIQIWLKDGKLTADVRSVENIEFTEDSNLMVSVP